MKEKSIVEDIYTKSEDTSVPILLNFQNGTLLTNRKEHTLFTKLKNQHDEKTAMVIVNDQFYQGPIIDTNELTDLYICIRSKSTNKVRILPIEQAQLNNRIYNSLETQKRNVDLSDRDKYKSLVKQFGGRKEARNVNSQQQTNLDMDLIKENLDNTVEASEIIDETTESAKNNHYLDSIRVKFDPDAKTIENVYNIVDVMSEDLLDRLDAEATALLTTDVTKIPIKSEFLRISLTSLQSSKKPAGEVSTKIKIIIFMDALLNLMQSREKVMKKIELSKITEKVENYIREHFKDTLGNRRSTFTTEKALCHFIVLALLLSDKYEVNIKSLQSELNITRAKIITYGSLVNAMHKPNSSLLCLRLPKSVTPDSGFFKRKTLKFQKK